MVAQASGARRAGARPLRVLHLGQYPLRLKRDRPLRRRLRRAHRQPHTFVSNFPDGYSTLVGERGVQLSGGQKQRIAIARAVLADPRMLLLDEATSALDAESEHIVQEAIDRLMINRTTVIVAHRLSTISGADTICVVNQGTIAEQGSHTELLAMGGIYKQLVSRQLAGSRSRDGSSVNLSAAGEADGDAATAPTS